MKKLIAISALSLATFGMTACHHTAQAQIKPTATALATTNTSYKNERHMTIAGVSFPVSETSARILVGADGQPLLVDDIFDGKADTPVAGYRIMVMNRASSVAVEGRTLKDGKVIDNRMIHRGSKARIGIPVVGGKVALDKAVLLDLDIIYDDPNAPLAEGQAFKPRGEKLTKKDVPVNDKKVVVRSFTLPNLATGENAGGGIDFTATATIEGKQVSTGANSAFQIFEGGMDEKRF